MYFRSSPLGFRMFLIRVGIGQECSVALDTSNYRTPVGKAPDRQRKLEPGCLEISVTPGSPAPLVCWLFLIRVRIYQGGSVSPDTSNYRMSEEKRARSTAETGTRLSGNISYATSPRSIMFRDFHEQRNHLPGRLCFARYIEL